MIWVAHVSLKGNPEGLACSFATALAREKSLAPLFLFRCEQWYRQASRRLVASLAGVQPFKVYEVCVALRNFGSPRRSYHTQGCSIRTKGEF